MRRGEFVVRIFGAFSANYQPVFSASHVWLQRFQHVQPPTATSHAILSSVLICVLVIGNTCLVQQPDGSSNASAKAEAPTCAGERFIHSEGFAWNRTEQEASRSKTKRIPNLARSLTENHFRQWSDGRDPRSKAIFAIESYSFFSLPGNSDWLPLVEPLWE